MRVSLKISMPCCKYVVVNRSSIGTANRHPGIKYVAWSIMHLNTTPLLHARDASIILATLTTYSPLTTREPTLWHVLPKATLIRFLKFLTVVDWDWSCHHPFAHFNSWEEHSTVPSLVISSPHEVAATNCSSLSFIAGGVVVHSVLGVQTQVPILLLQSLKLLLWFSVLLRTERKWRYCTSYDFKISLTCISRARI